ncbi:MAG TPA: glycosyltransferase family 2 protein [Patescibacteria group bacterium]|nr:glycosyltransferase family 2 protein [Patescibacteria group bacterium]
MEKKARTATLPTISIIFPTWNGKEETKKFLTSLKGVTYPKEKMDVVMVDNASTDGSQNAIRIQFPFVKIVELSLNIGFAAAVNVGLSHSLGDYIFVCNNDIRLHPDTVTLLVSYLQKHPDVGVVGPRIFFADAPKRTSFSGYNFNFWTGDIRSLPHPEKTKETMWVQGCAMCFRRTLLDHVGLFDEGFFFSFEDSDFCLRATQKGFTHVYYPKAVLWHGENKSIDTLGAAQKNFQLYRSKFRFLFKHGNVLQIFSSLFLQFTLIGIFKNIVLKDGVWLPILRGFFSYPVMLQALWWNMLHLPQTHEARKKGFLTFPKPERRKQ